MAEHVGVKAPGSAKIAIVLPAVAFSTSKLFGPIEQPFAFDFDVFLQGAGGQLVSDFEHENLLL